MRIYIYIYIYIYNITRCIADRNLKEILRSQATSNLILQDIKERIHRIEDVIRNQAPVLTKSSEDSLIAELLPLQTIEAIRNFDLLLHDTNEAVTQFVSFNSIFILIYTTVL